MPGLPLRSSNESIMSHTSEAQLLQAVTELVAIESTADNPAGLRAAYEYMRELLLARGKDITIEEFGTGKPSLLAYRGESRPDRFRVILNVHVDVVPGKPEQFIPSIRDGKLYGRGAYDMKAAAIVLADTFCEYVNTVPYALGLQIVTDEEDAGKLGTRHQVEDGVQADFIICGECGRSVGTYEIANEAKGISALEVCFSGDNVHGAYPWRGDNAALKATEFVRKLHDAFPVPTQPTGETTIALIGLTTSCTAHNQTPELTVVKLDCRYAPNDPRFETPETVTELIHSIDAEATITRFITWGPPMYTNPHNPLLQELKAAAEQVEGTSFAFVRRNGSGDGRFYTATGGEACEFGIAGEHQHANDEHITLEAFKNYVDTMRTFMDKTRIPEVAARYMAATNG
jgi:succinyl-diaminopimelate desuccinylase